MSTLFINASGDHNGNTVRLARELLAGKEYDQIDLVDMKVYDYGSDFSDDQFDEVLSQIKAADTLVIGSPVYWHDLSGMLRCLLDRFYGPVSEGSMAGKRLFFLFQGGAPTAEMFHRGEFTMRRFAGLYGMDFMGMATNDREAREMAALV